VKKENFKKMKRYRRKMDWEKRTRRKKKFRKMN